MDTATLKRNWLRVAVNLLALLPVAGRLLADEVVSNLANKWPGDWVSIGDIQPLVPYGPFTVHFFTGGGASESNGFNAIPLAVGPTNAASFQLNWVTFEFIGGHLQPWADGQVWLYQQVGTNSTLIGQLGIPAVDPRLTEWPESRNPGFCTTYVDFLPSTNICLQPQSEYWVALSTGGTDFGALFTLYSNFVATADWQMGPTGAPHDPSAANEFLKFAVDVTANGGLCSAGSTVSNFCLSATKVGTNLLLRWPASPYKLYSTERVEPAAWGPVLATPFRSNADLVVKIPLSPADQYFQLRTP